MLHHVGVGANEQEIEKLKQLGLEFIAQEQLIPFPSYKLTDDF
jgi:hypothetical protein